MNYIAFSRQYSTEFAGKSAQYYLQKEDKTFNKSSIYFTKQRFVYVEKIFIYIYKISFL